MTTYASPVTVLVIHWGQSGAGPRLAHGMARALREVSDVDVAFSYASNADNASASQDLDVPQHSIRTYRSKLGVITGLPRLVVGVIGLRRFIRSHKIDVVVSPMFSIWQSLAVHVALPRSVLYLASVHDAVAHPGDGSMAWAVATRLDRSRADGFIVYSEAVEAQLIESGVAKPIWRTIHPVFAREDSPSAVRGGPVRVIGMFGRMLPYKGLDIFADAIRILRERGFEVDAPVVGDGPALGTLSPELRQQIRSVPGWVDDGQVNEVVASFDVLALPYIEASQSGVLAVALAEGVPTVVTPVGGLVEQVEQTSAGLLASEVTSEAFADALESLIRDPAKYECLSAAAKAAADGAFSWARVGRDVLNATHEVRMHERAAR
ncbi:glycosyltransferase family 4 protein [Agromyces bauzanensis]|uniref:D-inositol 3-phosphate glycosyltransferase n=1 Tax=Agromyces bauzanensis TaxID=1308924 RepID=A0A917UWE2_9MICO|nr:glycosyltransferase [Agromyces bauzanensis]GGJ90137.1 hypothetical protein GCM10011372_30840 [Agromyces bauzanensis]